MRRSHAFTLVELLVVIGIIALLVGILLPALGAARRQAATVKCAAGLREIGNCFKLYEVENRGYWPVARLNGHWSSTGAIIKYNIDGVDYPLPVPGFADQQAYWFTFLAKYATKGKVGAAVLTNATDAGIARQTIFYACPAWQGYTGGGVVVGGANVVQPGYGMNAYPTFTDRYPTTVYPPRREWAVIDPSAAGSRPNDGNFFKAKTWTRPAERMLVADSRFWLAQSGRAPNAASWPPAVVAQPIVQNSAAGYGDDSTQSLIDMYRHGKTPRLIGTNYEPRGGKISYNILYADGHVATAIDGREAYRSIRMKFPG